MRSLILVRHAHRDKHLGSDFDNGLSERGLKQARTLSKDLFKAISGREARLFSSPKARCVETLQPFSEAIDQAIEIEPLLVEGDSDRALHECAKNFDRNFKASQTPVWVACSHGDWLPVFTDFALGMAIDFKKAAWIELLECSGKYELSDNRPKSEDPDT